MNINIIRAFIALKQLALEQKGLMAQIARMESRTASEN